MQTGEYDRLREMEDGHWWYSVLRWLVRQELGKRLPTGAVLLDVGCGTGGMLSQLTQWQGHGVDISPEALKLCAGRGVHQVCEGSANALPFMDMTFDAVVCLDVLYHEAVDEEKALAEIVRVLKPGGLLVLNLPAFNCLRGGHDALVCGARRYKACQVRKWLQSHNLKVKMIHYWNAWLFLPLLLRRWWTSDTPASDLHSSPSWLNACLAAIGKADALMCRFLGVPCGSSVFSVASKKARRTHT